MVLITSLFDFLIFSIISYSFQGKHLSHLVSHLQAGVEMTVIVSVLAPRVYISVGFNDLLMDECLSSERGFSSPLECPGRSHV